MRSHTRVDRRRLVALSATASLLGMTSQASIGAQTVQTSQPDATPVPEQLGQLRIHHAPSPPAAVSATGVARGGALRILSGATLASPTQLSPVTFQQNYGLLTSYLESLVRPDPVTLEPTPGLATSWDWNADRTVITYRLRRDVTWHDGSPFTAADARFSFFVHRDDPASESRNDFVLMDNAEAVDDVTLRITLLAPDYAWTLNASSQPIFQRAQYVEHWQDRPAGERSLTGFNWIERFPLGTGPWLLTAITDESVELARYDNYWDEPAYLDALFFATEPDNQTRVQRWRDGQADIIWPVSGTSVATARDTPGNLFVVDSPRVAFAAFNLNNPNRAIPGLLSDPRVRRALSLATDRDHYAETAWGGWIRQDRTGTVAQPWAHDQELQNPRHSPSAARVLFTEANWADRDGDGIIEDPNGIPAVLSLIVRSDSDPALIMSLESLVGDWAVVGVALAIEVLDPDAFAIRWLDQLDYDLIAFSYRVPPGFTDFDLYGSPWDIRENIQGFNPGGYRSGAADLAIASLFDAPADDLDIQREILLELQRAVDNDLFAIWLGFPQDLVLTRSDLEGFAPSALWPVANLHRAWLEM